MKDRIEEVTNALTALCRRAGVDPGDGSLTAGRRVVHQLRWRGCLDLPDDAAYWEPDRCPVAVWVRLETGLAVYVQGPSHYGGDPGQVILMGDRSVYHDINGMMHSTKDRICVPLPPAVGAAVGIVDQSVGGEYQRTEGAA